MEHGKCMEHYEDHQKRYPSGGNATTANCGGQIVTSGTGEKETRGSVQCVTSSGKRPLQCVQSITISQMSRWKAKQ